MATTALRLVGPLLLAASPAAASFSLDTVVQDYWYYVHNHLAQSTSQACLDAYSTPIDCDKTLLGMASSGSPNFNPVVSDLESMCSGTCKKSLDSYLDGIKAACSFDAGDAAIVHDRAKPYPEVPVDVVAEVFQYNYARACSWNGTDWCYFGYSYGNNPNWARSDPPCSDSCALNFLANAHNYPGSNYTFRIYELEYQSSWWENVYAEGWETVQECRNKNGGDSTGTTLKGASSTKTSSETTSTAEPTTSTSVEASETPGATSTSDGASASTSASDASATSPPATGSASGLGNSPFAMLVLCSAITLFWV